MNTPYRKRIIQLEFLYREDEIEADGLSPNDMIREAVDGCVSMVSKEISTEILSEQQMRDALVEQGSDPEFLIYENEE